MNISEYQQLLKSLPEDKYKRFKSTSASTFKKYSDVNNILKLYDQLIEKVKDFENLSLKTQANIYDNLHKPLELFPEFKAKMNQEVFNTVLTRLQLLKKETNASIYKSKLKQSLDVKSTQNQQSNDMNINNNSSDDESVNDNEYNDDDSHIEISNNNVVYESDNESINNYNGSSDVLEIQLDTQLKQIYELQQENESLRLDVNKYESKIAKIFKILKYFVPDYVLEILKTSIED